MSATKSLDNIFSQENMKAYANSCLELAIDVPEFHAKTGFDTLVIPSRGAVPFFLGMTYALAKVKSEWGGIHEDFHQNLGVQSMLYPLLPEEAGISSSPQGKKIRVLLIPFTADLNVHRFDSTLNNETYTKLTREYWANVTAAFLQPTEQRLRNPYFKSFTDIVLRDIEKRNEVAELYEAFPQIERFAMIDTVISGRASNEILRAFDALSVSHGNGNLRPSAFLIVDKKGEILKRNRIFADYLMSKEQQGAVKLQRIPNIVSEDNGASLLGVAATLYPSVMRASRQLRMGGREFYVGAGSWHLCSEFGDDNIYLRTFTRFMDMVYKGVDYAYSESFGKSCMPKNWEKFEEARHEFKKHMHEEGTFSQKQLDGLNTINSLKLNRSYRPERVYETHSRVVHIPFEDNSTAKVIEKLKELPCVY